MVDHCYLVKTRIANCCHVVGKSTDLVDHDLALAGRRSILTILQRSYEEPVTVSIAWKARGYVAHATYHVLPCEVGG
jgi:hypothetical protein